MSEAMMSDRKRNLELDYINKFYGVSAILGERIAFTYRDREYGTIVGATNAHLRVLMDGEVEPRIFHPGWQIEYLGGAEKIDE